MSKPPNVQAVGARADSGLVMSLVRAVRPHQWTKNLLVFAAPAAAAALTDPGVLRRTLVALLAFIMASSGAYLVNDIQDREADARHPVKRFRPIASGELPIAVAAVAAAVLVPGAVIVAAVFGTPSLGLVIAIYLIGTIGYSMGLKRVPLVELMIVAAGFALRAVAGAVANDLDISQWFLIVTSFGSLYLVVAKRYAEMMETDDGDGATRSVLNSYSLELLREIRVTAVAATILSYVGWAFENAESGGAIWFEVSIVPFVLALYRYAMVVDGGAGEAPEDIIRHDRPLQLAGMVWAVFFGVALSVS